jgi:hypothetical protein
LRQRCAKSSWPTGHVDRYAETRKAPLDTLVVE